MTSDLMPSPESSNSNTSNEVDSVVAPKNVPDEANASGVSDSSDNPTGTANDTQMVSRQQPIPPPSEPMQYRAIGLVRGRYLASVEQFTQGSLLTSDGVLLDSVLLGRIMSLVKNHLDLEKEHLWVVYPRTRQENDKLHLQIVGVWEPENLAKHQVIDMQDSETEASLESETPAEEMNNSAEAVLTPSSEVPDGGFSVRGEVVYQSAEAGSLVVKIKQAPRKQDDKPKYFKLKVKGLIQTKAVGKFWNLELKREGDELALLNAEAIADLPRKRRPPFKGGGGGRPSGGRKPFPPRRSGETPRPIKKGSDSAAVAPPTKPIPSRPVPKPVKKPKPPQE
jgi:hypothetical protein